MRNGSRSRRPCLISWFCLYERNSYVEKSILQMVLFWILGSILYMVISVVVIRFLVYLVSLFYPQFHEKYLSVPLLCHDQVRPPGPDP